MTELLINLIQDWINSMGTTLTDFIKDLYYFVFFIEEQFKDVTSSGSGNYFIDFNAIYRTVYAWGLVFLIIIFIKKIIQTYFLFKTGEEDQSPVRLVIGLIEAVIIDITFGWIYVFIVKMGYSFYLSLNASAGFNFDSEFMTQLANSAGWGLFSAICILIITCEFLGLIWNMIKRGIQILILRLIIPITTIGLLDANGGSFAIVAKKLLQNIFSVIVQLLLMSFSLVLIEKKRYVYAVASMAMTIEGPDFLRDFLAGAGGLGLAQMASKGASFAHHAMSVPGQTARGIGTATETIHNGISAIGNGAKASASQFSQGFKNVKASAMNNAVGNTDGAIKNGLKAAGHAALGVVAPLATLGYSVGRQLGTNDPNARIRDSAENFSSKIANVGVPNKLANNSQASSNNTQKNPPVNNDGGQSSRQL